MEISHVLGQGEGNDGDGGMTNAKLLEVKVTQDIVTQLKKHEMCI